AAGDRQVRIAAAPGPAGVGCVEREQSQVPDHGADGFHELGLGHGGRTGIAGHGAPRVRALRPAAGLWRVTGIGICLASEPSLSGPWGTRGLCEFAAERVEVRPRRAGVVTLRVPIRPESGPWFCPWF